MFRSKVAAAAALAFIAGTLSGCSAPSDTASESFSETAPDVVDETVNQLARDFNCGLVSSFTAGKLYDETWNTYETWEHWEKNLWQDLDADDPGSWNAVMELRRVTYLEYGAVPPTLGNFYSWNEAAQTADSVYVDDVLSDSEKAVVVDNAAAICPAFDSQFWDKTFYIRDFAF